MSDEDKAQKLEEKAKELELRRANERKELAFDLGWIAAKQNKSISINPYVSHEIEIEGEEKVISEQDTLSATWIEGFNKFKGSK